MEKIERAIQSGTMYREILTPEVKIVCVSMPTYNIIIIIIIRNSMDYYENFLALWVFGEWKLS